MKRLCTPTLQQRLHQIWRESQTTGWILKDIRFAWLARIIRTLVAFNGDQVHEEPPACFLVRGSSDERPLNEFDYLSADLRARLLYQAMVLLGEGWDEFSLSYAQYAHQHPRMFYYAESPMFGFLKFLSKSMLPDWMANWSAFAPEVRDP